MRNGLATLALVLVVLGVFIAVVWSNSQPNAPLMPVIPTQPQITQAAASWQDVLRAGLNVGGTPVPTIAIPDRDYVPPTLPPDDAPTPTPAEAAALLSRPQDVYASGATPTPPLATLPPIGTPDAAQPVRTLIVGTDRPIPTNPPSLAVPLARHPFDHYWFIRPIDSNRTNYASPYYGYGTNGPVDAPLRIHHGVDMPNPVGTTVRAAARGTVIFVTDVDTPIYQDSPAYGGVVVIQHDFNYRGLPVYTLYAHTEAQLVKAGDRVEEGQAIALVGNTGLSSGPHVHFEVRVGTSSYGSTYNPVLWMAPYVGHGTLAGQVVDLRGNFIDDAEVTLSRGGLTRATTTTYVFRDVGSRVNSDANWQENFAFGDVPAGRYTVTATINGERISQIVEVREGMTSFARLEPLQPVENVASPEAPDS